MNKTFIIGAIATIVVIGLIGLVVRQQQSKEAMTTNTTVSITGYVVSPVPTGTGNLTVSPVSASSDIDTQLKAFEDSLSQTNESDFDSSGLSDKELGL